MRTALVIAAWSMACSSPATPKPEQKHPALKLDRAALDAWADRELAPHLPAVVVGVVAGDDLVWHRGAGSRDGRGGTAPDRLARFRIGSITKLFTAIAVIQLRDRGLLDLDAPVSTWVPELEPARPAGDRPAITLRHLLTHTSGIPSVGNGSAPYWTQRGPTEAEMLRALDAPLQFPPGSRSEYSNAGMALAGVIVARASKRSYRDTMASEVFAPLGIAPAWDREAVPKSVRVAGKGIDGTIDPPSWVLGAFEPAGGLWASLDDMVQLARFALGRPGADRVLAPASRSLMMTDDPLPGSHGMAWIIGDGGVGHTGSTGDFAATIIVAPDKTIAAIVLASSGATKLTDCAAAALVRAIPAGKSPASCASAIPRRIDRAAVTAALDRLIAFIAAPDETNARETFSPSFLDAVPVPNLITMTQDVAAMAGTCTGHAVRKLGDTGGEAVLTCTKGKLAIVFTVERDPPHRLDSAQVVGME